MAGFAISTPTPESYLEIERKVERLRPRYPGIIIEQVMQSGTEFPTCVGVEVLEQGVSDEELRRAYDEA